MADDLEADVARVAALRRMSAAQVSQAKERSSEAWQAALAAGKSLTVRALFEPMSGTVRDQMAAFDRLPQRSREFLIGLDRDVSARRWEIALEAHAGDEEGLIRLAQHFMAFGALP